MQYWKGSQRATIPNSWQPMFAELDAELDKIQLMPSRKSCSWKTSSNIAKMCLLGSKTIFFGTNGPKTPRKKSAKNPQKVRKYPQKYANRDFCTKCFFKWQVSGLKWRAVAKTEHNCYDTVHQRRSLLGKWWRFHRQNEQNGSHLPSKRAHFQGIRKDIVQYSVQFSLLKVQETCGGPRGETAT